MPCSANDDVVYEQPLLQYLNSNTTIAFSTLCNKTNNNIYKCLKIFIINFQSNGENFIKKYLPKIKSDKKISFDTLIDIYSKQLRRKIVIFAKENDRQLDSPMHILFTAKTKYTSEGIPIYLKFEENSSDSVENDGHISFIFEVNTFTSSKPSKQRFCLLCCKNFSYAGFSRHNCCHKRCKYCFNFIAHNDSDYFDELGVKKCRSEFSKNTVKICENCDKMFLNLDCSLEHKKHCNFFVSCSTCKKRFRKNSKHFCGKYFCRKCLNWHDIDQKSCFIGSDIVSKKNRNLNFFFMTGITRYNYLKIKKSENIPISTLIFCPLTTDTE